MISDMHEGHLSLLYTHRVRRRGGFLRVKGSNSNRGIVTGEFLWVVVVVQKGAVRDDSPSWWGRGNTVSSVFVQGAVPLAYISRFNNHDTGTWYMIHDIMISTSHTYNIQCCYRCIIATCSVLVLVTRWKCKTYLLMLIAAHYIVAGGKSTV